MRQRTEKLEQAKRVRAATGWRLNMRQPAPYSPLIAASASLIRSFCFLIWETTA